MTQHVTKIWSSYIKTCALNHRRVEYWSTHERTLLDSKSLYHSDVYNILWCWHGMLILNTSFRNGWILHKNISRWKGGGRIIIKHVWHWIWSWSVSVVKNRKNNNGMGVANRLCIYIERFNTLFHAEKDKHILLTMYGQKHN